MASGVVPDFRLSPILWVLLKGPWGLYRGLYGLGFRVQGLGMFRVSKIRDAMFCGSP